MRDYESNNDNILTDTCWVANSLEILAFCSVDLARGQTKKKRRKTNSLPSPTLSVPWNLNCVEKRTNGLEYYCVYPFMINKVLRRKKQLDILLAITARRSEHCSIFNFAYICLSAAMLIVIVRLCYRTVPQVMNICRWDAS